VCLLPLLSWSNDPALSFRRTIVLYIRLGIKTRLRALLLQYPAAGCQWQRKHHLTSDVSTNWETNTVNLLNFLFQNGLFPSVPLSNFSHGKKEINHRLGVWRQQEILRERLKHPGHMKHCRLGIPLLFIFSLFSWLSSCQPSLRVFLLLAKAKRETLGARSLLGESERQGSTRQTGAPNLGLRYHKGHEKSPCFKRRREKKGGDVALPELAGRDFSHIPQSFN